MLAFVAVPLTCWMCALLAFPGKPIAGHELQELVYRRLVGRQQLLMAVAAVATLAVTIGVVISALAAALPEARP